MSVSRRLVIGHHDIEENSPAFVIGEVGHNHMGRIDVAVELVHTLRWSGFHAYKLQKRTNDKLYTRAFYDSPYHSEVAYGDTYGKHREALEFDLTKYNIVKEECNANGIVFFATAFDEDAADFLEFVGVPAYKIASAGARDVRLLKHVARKEKPMLISTGGCTLDDVKRLMDWIMPINEQVALLQCTAAYPAKPQDLNLRVIETYLKEFPDNVIGFSDHQDGIDMAVAAYALGARIFEKHVTLDHSAKGTDHAFSLEPEGMRRYVKSLHRTYEALGNGIKTPYPVEEKPLKKMRRSLHAGEFLNPGTVLDKNNIALKSPDDGVPAQKYEWALGKRVTSPYRADDPLSSKGME